MAWSSDYLNIRKALLALLDTFPAETDVLLKTRRGSSEIKEYDRWHGDVATPTIQQAISDFPGYVYQCGFDVLCLRNPETHEYLALDEYGLLWFYSREMQRETTFKNAGFEHKRNPLITDSGLWIVTLQNHEELREAFTRQLGLKRVAD